MNIGKQKLISILDNRYDAKHHSDNWYMISCPFCGDSPNPHSRHCNIRVSEDDDIVIVHCFQLKCHSSGVMNREHLKQMGIYDKDIIGFVECNYDESKRAMRKSYNNSMTWIMNTKSAKGILSYYKARTKTRLTSDIAEKYRIVTSVKEFIELNRENLNDKVIKRLKMVKQPSIGFMNSSGTFIEFRYAGDDVPKNSRFLKVSLTTDERCQYQTHKPYIIERANEYALGDKGYIVLCEGKFDLINVHKHIMPTCDGIWISSTVGGFRSIINTMTKKYPYRKLVVVADADVRDKQIISMVEGIEYRISGLSIIRNEASKDFGDLREAQAPVRVDIF